MKVSIVTPSFRSSQWLKLCIASVADQEGVDTEHIVQDSCSDDGTGDWLPEDARVKAFIEKDTGMYDAINRGLERSTGEILAYLNCDEQYLPGALKAIVDFFEANPTVDVLFADTVVVDANGDFVCYRKVTPPGKYHIMVAILPVLTCSIFFRRQVFEEYGFAFDTRFKDIADAYWVLRVLRNKVSYGVLNCYTSTFTDTDHNMNLLPNARREVKELHDAAPLWARLLRPLIVVNHRIKRWRAGAYKQAPFSYEVFTQSSPEHRVHFQVDKPSFVWRSRLQLFR